MPGMEKIPVPRKTLTVSDAVFIVVGVVIGAGIFRTPSIVAANASGPIVVIALWLAGGIVSLAGALTYAELATTYPSTGGDYLYISKSWGGKVSFLYAWARMTVIQTGSIAMFAFIVGDYASGIVPLGAYSVSLYAAGTVILLTLANAEGIRPGLLVQKSLLTAIVAGLVILAAAAISFSSPETGVTDSGGITVVGRAMIFVLLTYGGWNEAAFLSAEVFNSRKSMVRVMVTSISIITATYLLVNAAFLLSLGRAGMTESDTIAATLISRLLGGAGATVVSLFIIAAALSSMNGVIITGARTNYALGRDYPLFGFMGRWNHQAGTPAAAIVFQGIIALALVVLGTVSRSGFTTMVDYTAPVYWLFLLVATSSLFILRRRDGAVKRTYSVPLYPFTPLMFMAVCAYMFHASVAFTGVGALVGLAVLAAGVPFMLTARKER